MKLSRIVFAVMFICLFISCKSKDADKNVSAENTFKSDYSHEVFPEGESNVEMIYSIEYYKEQITEYQNNYYGFNNLSMNITQMMNISLIKKIDSLVPGFLTFIVCWFNPKGYVYYVYVFNAEQKITGHYYCGDFVSFDDYKKIMEKMGGEKLEYGSISIGDFNGDEKNEIAVYSFYKNIGNVFCVFGYNALENELSELCLIPVFINYDDPFPSVEYTGNGFRILEIVDDELTELAWNQYVWESGAGKYIKQ